MIVKCSVQKHNKQTTFIQSNTTQVYFNSVDYPYMYAACFGLYLGHPQASQYNHRTKEDTIKLECIFLCTT
jgi:hypothetical protein